MPDVANLILLRLRSRSSHQHVVLHTLAERVDRRIGRNIIHGKFLSFKGTPRPDGDSASFKTYK